MQGGFVLVQDDPVGQFPMWLKVLPALHDAEVPYLRKFTIRMFFESPDLPLSDLAYKEIAGTAWVIDNFRISHMVQSVWGSCHFPDDKHDSSEGELLPVPDPLCLWTHFFGFIALVFLVEMPLTIKMARFVFFAPSASVAI